MLYVMIMNQFQEILEINGRFFMKSSWKEDSEVVYSFNHKKSSKISHQLAISCILLTQVILRVIFPIYSLLMFHRVTEVTVIPV